MNRGEIERALRIVARAWGRTQSGYAFFPWIDREEQKRTGQRRAGFHEGPAFLWPEEKSKIIDHIASHTHHDLYWCPSLFEYEERKEAWAMDEHALWADLDEVDPNTLTEYMPTIAWETSPGRYQALWIAASGDFQGASWPGNENQRMTYLIGADSSGWDTIQLLRLPGWANYKPEKASDGEAPQGRLLWSDGPTYQPGDFAHLPEVRGALTSSVTDALETDIELVDRHKVMARVKLKMPKRARELLSARETSGDISGSLWYLHRCLADAGCSIAEIVAISRETVWNKFRDRADEMRVLITEASKAIAQRSEEVTEALEEEEGRKPLQRLGALLANVKRPKYIVEGILTEMACGFIAGEPKCFKSWVGMDLAFSVSTGAPFLGEFRVNEPGPVLYIQEEDPAPTLKTRSAKIWASKAIDELVLVEEDGMPGVEWLPAQADKEFDPDINAYIQEGVTISDESWILWLDEQLAAGMPGKNGPTPYRLLIIDTLMMTAGEVEENKSQEMTTKIFRPLKTLSRKHNVAIQVVHHMGKSERARPGQRMLGSVANHAWAEDSIYLSRSGVADIRIDLESKTTPGGVYRLSNVVNKRDWSPQVAPWRADDDADPITTPKPARPPKAAPERPESAGSTGAMTTRQLTAYIKKQGSVTTGAIADEFNISRPTAWRKLRYLQDKGKATSDNGVWTLS